MILKNKTNVKTFIPGILLALSHIFAPESAAGNALSNEMSKGECGPDGLYSNIALTYCEPQPASKCTNLQVTCTDKAQSDDLFVKEMHVKNLNPTNVTVHFKGKHLLPQDFMLYTEQLQSTTLQPNEEQTLSIMHSCFTFPRLTVSGDSQLTSTPDYVARFISLVGCE
ncbi:MAG: hypothetical protein J0G29_06385 [Alphaproteobacteria bacterium]|nr:hypothetical protein [Alphaproteobacteria bacterium]OJV46317.1 MAG: hypothetical protein BGO28_03040 [Alphaproteobacteria bacterium 43-37]